MRVAWRSGRGRRLRPSIAVLSCAVVALLLSPAGPSSAAPTGQGPNPPATDDACIPIPVVSITYETIDGTPLAGPSATAAIIYHYALAPGDDIEHIEPPKSFSPLSATNVQLAAMGFVPRPTDPAQLAEWNARYANFKGFAEEQPCVLDRNEN